MSELLVFLLPRVNSVHLDHLQICGQEVGLGLGSWFVHVYIVIYSGIYIWVMDNSRTFVNIIIIIDASGDGLWIPKLCKYMLMVCGDAFT